MNRYIRMEPVYQDGELIYLLHKTPGNNGECDGCGRKHSNGYTIFRIDGATAMIAGFTCCIDCAVNTIGADT